MISESKRLCHCSQMSSQLVDLVSFSTFKCAHKPLLTISKLSNPIPIPLSPCWNQSINQHPSSGSTKLGAEVTTLSPALLCHAATPTETTTTSMPNSHQHPTSKLLEVAIPLTTKQPLHQTSQVQMVHSIVVALCKCDQLTNLMR